MAELSPISDSYDEVETHVIFVHGLSGDPQTTWTIKQGNSSIIWPRWLAEDISRLGLWLVGYPAAITRWKGHSMPLSDRADNILALLLAESRLENGNIIFIAHSLGGLIVEQLLRNAQRDSGNDRKTEDFLLRVKRIAFLGTPHRGSLANLAKRIPLLRPSEATDGLTLGNAQLRDLNNWYRQHSRDYGIENLVLAEGQPEKIFGINLPGIIGKIVHPSSADAGLPKHPIIVDESHISICKPSSRGAEVYIHLRDFIRQSFVNPKRLTQTKEALDKNTAQIEKLITHSRSQEDALSQLSIQISQNAATASTQNTELIDAEITRKIERLRQVRLLDTTEVIDDAKRLVDSLLNRSLAPASQKIQDIALAWCARVLSIDAPYEAQKALDAISRKDTEIAVTARGLFVAIQGNLQEALGELASIDSLICRSAAYVSVLRVKGFEDALKWLQETKLLLKDLDSDAKYFYLRAALENSKWNLAFEIAQEITAVDYDNTPALIIAVADAYLMQATPDDLRIQLMRYIPFNATNFPLRGDPKSLEYRRTAAELYGKMCSIANKLEIDNVANYVGDRGLWLRLTDPEKTSEAQHELAESVSDPATLLRRLDLAFQFGVTVDSVQVEQEVNRLTALSGGTSRDAAVARFALAGAQKSREAAAAYIEKHRNQLLDHLEWRGVYFFEIEMLATTGQHSQAQLRLQEALSRGLTTEEFNRLQHLLAESAGADPITERLKAYEENKSSTELRLLISAYEAAKIWEKAIELGQILIESTGYIADARSYVIALYNNGDLLNALAVYEKFPALKTSYNDLALLYAQTLFELGHLNSARSELNVVRQTNDSTEARQLLINLAIISGDWESLQSFVEDEWGARTERSAIELLRAGQIAHQIGGARERELVRLAAQQASDNPTVLVNCYQAATEAGWENNPEVAHWLEQAINLSKQDENAPIQAISLEELIERKPGWDKHESNIWNLLTKGEIPNFTAGQFLHRSLIDLLLLPAISNLSKTDVRKRSIVLSFSGQRGASSMSPHTIALDPTSLLTAEFLGILGLYINTFSQVIIPHNTLGWLFEEKAKILFHQPSRVRTAHHFQRMLSEHLLQIFESSTVPQESLIREVGEELAILLTEAASKHLPDAKPRLVVRSGPIYKASTFIREEANLAGYEAYLCSSFDVIDKLVQKGVLMTQEAEEARTLLRVREKPWHSKTEIPDEAILYLDSLAASTLEHLGVISKLRRAGITAVISQNLITEGNALISYNEIGGDAIHIVEQIRTRLREGLETGKIRLSRAVRVNVDSQPIERLTHPTLSLLKQVENVDAYVIDDRFINQHQHTVIPTDPLPRPLLTTLDLLEVLHQRGALSMEGKQRARIKLQQASFALIPLEHEELFKLLNSASVTNGTLNETAELRAIRENLQRVRMSEVFQYPKESPWFNGVNQAIFQTLKALWDTDVNEQVAAAKSNWLVELSDVRGWAHRLNENTQQQIDHYREWLTTLILMATDKPPHVQEAYWRWLDSHILRALTEESPETFAFIVENMKQRVTQGIKASIQYLDIPDE